MQIARGTRLRLSPSIRCQLVSSRSSQAQSGIFVSSNTDTSRLPSRSSRRPTHAFAHRASARHPSLASRAKDGGARRDRTDDLMLAKHALSQLSYGPELGAWHSSIRQRTQIPAPITHNPRSKRVIMVGLGRFELPTSRLSSARSNQLSYRPLKRVSV